MVESIWVSGFGARSDPLWFDLLGAATLFASTIAGGHLWGRFARRRRRALSGRAASS